MVIGIGVPRPVGLKRACGLAAIGVAQIRRDNAVFALELVQRVKRVVRQARERCGCSGSIFKARANDAGCGRDSMVSDAIRSGQRSAMIQARLPPQS